MNIRRIDPDHRMSEAVIHNNLVYYTSVPENLDAEIKAQTRNTLENIDRLLQRVGSDKSNIIDATLFLANKDDFSAMNEIWDSWVAPGNAPVRCTVQAQLMHPQYKIEIKIIAAIA